MNSKFKKILAIILLVLSFSNNSQAIVAERVDTDVSAFNGNLSATDDNVQDALNTIDNLSITPTTRTISTTGPLSGGGDLSTNRTFSIADSVADGSTKGASSFTANDFDSTSGNISLDYTNGQAASGSTKGFLTSSDWTTFNNKFTLPSLTNGSALFSNGTTIAQDNQNFYWDDTYNRLSTFNTLSSEILTNGTFTSSSSGWSLASGWAYSSNTVLKNSNGTGTLSQSVTAKITNEYILTYTISNWTVGTVTPSFGGWTGTAVSANGTYTERIVATSVTGLAFTPSNTARFTIDTISLKLLKGTNTATNFNTGGVNIQGEWSNGSPGTTRAMTFNNDGSYSWTDYRFAGTLRGSFGYDSSGGLNIYQSGGSGVILYQCNSGLGSCSYYEYSTQSALVHTGYGEFNNGVHAGANYAPTSTLQTAGGLALQVKRITASQTLDNTATHWLCDASTAAACTGTASTACTSHGSQGACESNDAHGGCTWNAGNSCSAFDYESGMGTCAGTSGCSVSTSSCSGGYDESSCIGQDDSYGGNCTWDGTDCSTLPDEGTCGSYSGSGCTANYSDCSTYNDNYAGCTGQAGCTSSSATDCSTYDGTDQGTCEGNSGCYWDGMSNCYNTCSGTYYTGCSGTYYTCNGNYNTGSCTGTYGSGCTGTPNCTVINDSTSCGAETGCTWSAVLNATLPSIASYPHRTYWVQNDTSSGADVVLLPDSGSTINGASSYTLANYQDGVHLAPYHDLRNCSEFITLGACTPTGCSPSYTACSWDGMTDCSGDSACDSADNTDSMTCNAITYFSSCSGQYTVTKDWHAWSKNDTTSGTYTPTLTNTTNIGASTARLATYTRVGSTVTVSGQLDIDPTSTGAVLLGISLPIASAFTTVYQLGGVGSTIAIANESYGIEADATNDRASMKNIAVSTANHTVTYTFTYQLI